MATARLDELKARFDENPRRYFAPYANELRKHGDFHQAIAICRTHLVAQPAHVSGHIVLAQALHEAGEIDDARSAFEAALGVDPENLIALRYMGDIARERGEIDVARTWYQRVLEADPRNEEIAQVLSSLSAQPAAEAPPAMPFAPPLMMGLEPPPPPPAAPVTSAPSNANPDSAPARDDATSTSAEALASADSRAGDELAAGAPPTPTTPPAAAESAPAPSFGESTERVPPANDGTDATMADASPVPIEDYAPAMDASTSSNGVQDVIDDGADFATDDLTGYDGAWADELERSLEDASDGPQSAWEPKATPAVDFSDYEAAPDPFFENDMEFASADADAAASSDSDFAGWFDEPPAGAMDAPSASTEDATGDAGSPRDDGVELAEPSPPDAHESPVMERAPSVTPPRAWTAAPSPTPEGAVAPDESPAAIPFVTETLAELYVQQGFRDEALAIYRQLVAADPTNESLRGRLEALENSMPASAAAASMGAGDVPRAGESVRAFFGRLARRKPTRSTGGDSGMASGGGEADAASTSAPGPMDQMRAGPAGDERAERSALGDLFAAAKPSPADVDAASNLTAAFTDPPGQASPGGRPARMAERELSLDHLFRDTSRAPNDPTTLDEFYGQAKGGTAPDSPPDDDRNDDLQQFTAWLEGLRKK